MYKTIFLVRRNNDSGKMYIDSALSAEWPENITGAALEALAAAREESIKDTIQAVLSEQVQKLLKAYPSMELRARMNLMDSPYIVNSAEKPTDDELLEHYKTIRRRKRRSR